MAKSQLRFGALLLGTLLLAACGQTTPPTPTPIPPPPPTNPSPTPAPPTPIVNLPGAFSFPTLHTAPNVLVTSAPIIVMGLQQATVITASSGTLLINGQAVSGPVTVNNGDTVQVQLRSSPTRGEQVSSTVAIGLYNATFTLISDQSPDQITPQDPHAQPGEVVHLSTTANPSLGLTWAVTCTDLNGNALTGSSCGTLTVLDPQHADFTASDSGAYTITLVDGGGQVVSSTVVTVAPQVRDKDLWFSGYFSNPALGAYFPTVGYSSGNQRTGDTPDLRPTPGPAINSLSYGLAFDRSGNLWVSLTSRSQVVEFSKASLNSAAPTPIATLDAPVPTGLAFDQTGNLLVASPTGTLRRFPVSQLHTGGTPNVTFPLPGQVYGMAFDRARNLWLSNYAGGRLFAFTAAQLNAASASAPKVLKAAGVQFPLGVAFDGQGNLWTANLDQQTVTRFDAASLNEPDGATIAPGRTITTPGVYGFGLAFDLKGNLWTSSFVRNATADAAIRLPAAQLVGSGTAEATPTGTLKSEPQDFYFAGIAFSNGIAFRGY